MSAPAQSSHSSIGGDQLHLLKQRLRVHAGISIDRSPQGMEEHIRARMSLLGITDIADYLALFDQPVTARAEWLALVDLHSVKETGFFRQREAFECVADYVRKLVTVGPTPKEISFWSAGCATGQELYSIAMVVENILRGCQPWLQWHGVGSDLSFSAIQQAQDAHYPQAGSELIPIQFRRDYLETAKDGSCRIVDDIRARTHFLHSNLLHTNAAPFADFNIIFCQDVLGSFESEKQRWVIDQLVRRLKSDGLLILGAGEDVQWLNSSMRRVSWPGVCAYTKIGG